MNRERRLATRADIERYVREHAKAITPQEGLTILERLRALTYEDPEAPPRLERVYTLPVWPGEAAHTKTRKKQRRAKS